MKLLFSEARPDYAHYVFPYAVWAFPEPGETPADLFAAGFLPSSRELDRFYLCRHVRLPLAGFAPSSENRRILRKGDEGLTLTLMPRAEFAFTPERHEFCRRYTEARFAHEGMSADRLDALFHTPITTHVLHATDKATGADAGIVSLYVEEPRMAFYSYAFYDLTHSNRSLGMYLMTAAVRLFAERGFGHLYVGSCYSGGALYKTQFKGCEFFNGVRWSGDLEELKFVLNRQSKPDLAGHLLEDEAYRTAHLAESLSELASRSPFRAAPPAAG